MRLDTRVFASTVARRTFTLFDRAALAAVAPLIDALGGVDVQGYLIARPAPIHELVEQLPQLRDRLNPLLAQSQAGLMHSDADRDDAVTRLRGAVERQTRR